MEMSQLCRVNEGVNLYKAKTLGSFLLIDKAS